MRATADPSESTATPTGSTATGSTPTGSTASAATLAGTAPPALTPTLRTAARGTRFWLGLAAVAALVVVLGTLLAGIGASTQGTPLAPDNPAPRGAQALAQVLQTHSVAVANPHGYAAALDELREAPATLLLIDRGGILDGERLRSLREAAATTVLIEPGFDALASLLPGAAAAGRPETTAPAAGCGLAAAVRASTVTAGDASYRLTDASTYVTCFADADGRALLVHDPATSTTALAASDILSNEQIVARGNAALALGLLGEHPALVWYQPTLADAVGGAPPSRAELTPGWVTPAVVVLIAAALAAALWRGRRLGPLVVENLPVAVPARETMEGRARLYARSSARLRAIDALRIGAVARLTRALGLPRSASVEQVVGSVSERTGRHPDAVWHVLIGAEPESDRELLGLSARLEELEVAVRATVQDQTAPGRAPEGTEE